MRASVAILAFVSAAAQTRNPYVSAQDVAEGQRLYARNCRTCHGAQGERADRSARLASKIRHHGNSDAEMFRTISEGIPGTAMPGTYADEKSVWQILAFVRSLEDRVSPSDLLPLIAARPAAAGRPVLWEDLLHPERRPGEWLVYSGNLSGHRFSPLDQITSQNAATLELKWIYQRRLLDNFEASPLAAGGVLYLTTPPNDVVALDASTGELIWEYRRDLPSRIPACCGQVNRGLAMLGDRLFMATLDGFLLALDRATGRVVWQSRMADIRQGYTATLAPLVIHDLVLAGVSGGEYGIRGFVDAYRVSDGSHAWRTYTIPEPGEPDGKTWPGETWRRGGAPVWVTGTFDPALNLTYWGTGNPAPDWNGDVRPGDNLFSCSVLALDASTGRIQWHYQFTPHDVHDWDSNQIMVLVDRMWKGKPRKLLVTANRNGFFYILDRVSGELLHASPYVKQTWAKSIDAQGRPVENSEAYPSAQGTRVWPSAGGGTNWWPPAYSPRTGLFYVSAVERSGVFTRDEAVYEPGTLFEGGTTRTDVSGDFTASIRALDLTTGRVCWEHVLPARSRSGVLATGGDILVAATDNGRLQVLDARNGRLLFERSLGGVAMAGPIAFLDHGQERIALASGSALFVFGLRK